mmetsp:Transcript_159499/g.281530  ORF Transcript_159499/g.281530 Transcript_159499/m.281530 type:complete len:216 (-) Transcript_159499:47-694(-)
MSLIPHFTAMSNAAWNSSRNNHRLMLFRLNSFSGCTPCLNWPCLNLAAVLFHRVGQSSINTTPASAIPSWRTTFSARSILAGLKCMVPTSTTGIPVLASRKRNTCLLPLPSSPLPPLPWSSRGDPDGSPSGSLSCMESAILRAFLRGEPHPPPSPETDHVAELLLNPSKSSERRPNRFAAPSCRCSSAICDLPPWPERAKQANTKVANRMISEKH